MKQRALSEQFRELKEAAKEVVSTKCRAAWARYRSTKDQMVLQLDDLKAWYKEDKKTKVVHAHK